MEAVRKKYDREFKLEAIRLADKPGAVVRRVGRDPGLYHGTIRHWHEELQKDPAHTFMGTGHLTPLAEQKLFEYIEQFYNAQRQHASLGYLSPMAFEAQGLRLCA